MSFVPESFAELYLALMTRQLNRLLSPGSKRIQCCSCLGWGVSIDKLTSANLSLPPVLVMGFLVVEQGYRPVNCTIDESFQLGSSEFKLSGASVCVPGHFFAVTII